MTWRISAFDLAITLSAEADAYARDMAKTMAIDVEYWPTLDPSHTQGSREQILESLSACGAGWRST